MISQIGLRALESVQYKTLVPSILQANPDREITYPDMQLLWDAIIHKAYYFVCACERETKEIEIYTCRL